MAKIEITNDTHKNMVENLKAAQATGAGVEMVEVEGLGKIPMGYTSEADKEAGLAFMQMMVNQTKNPLEIPRQIYQMGQIAEYDITPEEQVEIDGHQIVIDVKAKKAYLLSDLETAIANMDDLDGIKDVKAIVEVLKARAQTYIAEMPNDDECCCHCDECCCDCEDDEYDW